jgi:hypothetical protein
MRTVIRSVRNAWLGHLALAAACVWALYVHAVYRVPLGPVTRFLPWLGVAATVLSALVLILGVLPGRPQGPIARGLDRLERRSGWAVIALVVTSLAGSACADGRWLSLTFLGLALSVTAAAIAATIRRLLVDGGRAIVEGLRRLQIAALVVAGLFLLWSLIVFVNGVFDTSVGVEHDSDVLAVASTVIDPGLGELVPHTHADLRSWRVPGRVEPLVLAPGEMRYVWVGQPVRVRVHPGALWIPWISALKLDDVRHARQILAVSPTGFIAMKRLVAALLERRQWDEALAAARQFVAAYPDDVGGIEYVVGLLGVAERYADQIELIGPVVARRPSYGPLCMLGFALDRSGDHHGAIPVLERATRLQPGDFLAWHYLGEANQAIERYEAAIAAYEAELKIRPRSREVRRRVQVFRAYLAAHDTRTAVTR